MLDEAIFAIQNDSDFEEITLRIFRYQYINNPVYQRFCNLLGVTKTSVQQSIDIPYLPIQFFKQEKVISTYAPDYKIFTSSGTTGSITSKHYVSNLRLYE